jgi:hypothetical protein
MGGGRGGSLTKGADDLREIHSKLLKEYSTSADGKRLGVTGKNRTQHIYSENPAKEAKSMFKKFSGNNQVKKLASGKGFYVLFKGNSRVNYRPISNSDGSPSIDIHFADTDTTYKIHFLPNKQ